MIQEFETVAHEISNLLMEWEPKLSLLTEEVITTKRNLQNRSIKQIIGHLVDSASNNTHRVIHLQYQENPLVFPNYASNGNNDRWIALQDYQNENWQNLIQLWKFSNMHYIHVIKNVNNNKVDNEWIAGTDKMISLKEMVVSYLPHFKLHLSEIDELISK
jgi:hypothetical protein